MEIASRQHAERFCESNGFPSPYFNREDSGLTLLHYHFEQEDHTQALYNIAKFIGSVCDKGEKVLGLVNKMSVWESGTDPHLLKLVLDDCFGESSNLFSNGTAFLWKREEGSSAVTLIHLALLFGWDLYLYPDTLSTMVFISHDGFLQVYAESDWSRIVEKFKQDTGRGFEVHN